LGIQFLFYDIDIPVHQLKERKKLSKVGNWFKEKNAFENYQNVNFLKFLKR